MESLLASYSLDEIQHLGQTIGGVLVAVFVLSIAFVAYKVIKRALFAADGYYSGPQNQEELEREYGKYNDWG